MNSKHLVSVPGGRTVAVESYGDPAGRPVFFFHGWPSSRWQGALGTEAACELGVHFLAVDRPGVGESDLHVGRTLRDWPALLGPLADHFGAEKFHVLGVSGGGPYALASAWGLPERVLGAAVVSGAPPIAERENISKLMPIYQWLIHAYRRHPNVVRRGFRWIRPVATIRPPNWMFGAMLRFIPACDRDILSQPNTMERAWAGYHGAWMGDPDGVFHDARIYAEPWGFDLADIRVPVHVWHGREDRNFHWPLAEELASKIPGARVHVLDHEGHYSLIVRRHREVLLDLMAPGDKG